MMTSSRPSQVGGADTSEESGNNISCVFWDFDANENGGDWSAAGCRLSKVIGDMVVCSCDHLTNFAILVVRELFNPTP